MMPSQDQVNAQNLYVNLLSEFNLRIAAINHCTMGLSGLAPPFIKDFCHLQIRLLCELIALGCLAAHGDIKQTTSNNMQKAWSAHRIMDALEKLHPHFYPKTVKQTKTAKGFHLQVVDPQPLPRAEFLKLYHKCDDHLHRGSLKKLLKGQLTHQINFPEITSKAQKLVDLMSHHILVMQNGEQMFIAMLSRENTGVPQVAIAETPQGQPMNFSSPTFLKDPLFD